MIRLGIALTAALFLVGCGDSEKKTASSDAHPEISDEQVVGKWENSWGDASVIVIYNSDNAHRMRENFEEGGEMDSLLEESKVAGKVRYTADYGRDIGEYYVIGPTGWLQF